MAENKTAYRALAQPESLATLWQEQDRSALFAYIHIPFCEMRCGFCNLFAMARPQPELVDRYVTQILAQMRVLDQVLGERRFARFAIGGGTPTYLAPAQLQALLDGARDILGIDLHATPAGIEASPETVTPERLAVCRALGIDRVSLGVQSFAAGECARWRGPSKTPSCSGPSARSARRVSRP